MKEYLKHIDGLDIPNSAKLNMIGNISEFIGKLYITVCKAEVRQFNKKYYRLDYVYVYVFKSTDDLNVIILN